VLISIKKDSLHGQAVVTRANAHSLMLDAFTLSQQLRPLLTVFDSTLLSSLIDSNGISVERAISSRSTSRQELWPAPWTMAKTISKSHPLP
jgi:hypothetical protein